VGVDQEPRVRHRLGYRTSAAVAAGLGAAAEAGVRLAAHGYSGAWDAARLPLLAALALALAQAPRRDTGSGAAPGTERPRRSELARHLDRRARRDDL
jgi:hypothetical protein